jgi:poly(3-hydroxybutyrate) depolymerase
MRTFFILVSLVFSCTSSPTAGVKTDKETFKRGEGTIEFTGHAPLSDKPITLHYYLPSRGNIKNTRVLFSMHGADRDGAVQVLIWKEFAEAYGFVVLAPEYSKALYDENAYQFGGVSTSAREFEPAPEERWTYQTIEAIFDYFKKETGNTRETYDMYGHSAGGQFVHRFLLAMPNARVGKAIAANAGSWTFPDTSGIVDDSGNRHGWPYSVQGTPFATGESLRRFLAKNLIVHLGTADTATSGANVPTSPAALAQGKHRYERGWNFFQASREIATRMQCPFNWKIVEVEGIGHAGRSMVYGKSRVVNGQRVFSIHDITNTGAYSLLFEQ